MNEIYYNLLLVAAIAVPLLILHLVHPAFVSRRKKFDRYVRELSNFPSAIDAHGNEETEQRRREVSLERYTWKENLTVLIDCVALVPIGLLLYQAWVMWQTLS